MFDAEKALQSLLSADIPEAIAVSMVNSMAKADAKQTVKKAKRANPNAFTDRKKQEIVLIHEDTCMTCGCIVTTRAVTLGYPEDDGDTVKGVRNLCHNCPKYLDSLDKEVLISLFLIQNSPDPDIRMLSNKHHIKLAHMKKPVEWIGYKIVRQDMSKPEREEK